MTDQRKDSDHWSELAELLGLPPEEPKQSPARAVDILNEPAPSPAPPAETIRTIHEEPKTEPLRWPEAHPISPLSENVDLAPARLPIADEADEDRSPRGRHRGRRGRRGRDDDRDTSRGPDGALPSVSCEADKLEDADSESIIDPVRSDSWHDDRATEGFEDTAADDVEESPAPAEDEDDAEIDRLKDWNVPSWNELIASLYRPDR